MGTEGRAEAGHWQGGNRSGFASGPQLVAFATFNAELSFPMFNYVRKDCLWSFFVPWKSSHISLQMVSEIVFIIHASRMMILHWFWKIFCCRHPCLFLLSFVLTWTISKGKVILLPASISGGRYWMLSSVPVISYLSVGNLPCLYFSFHI